MTQNGHKGILSGERNRGGMGGCGGGHWVEKPQKEIPTSTRRRQWHPTPVLLPGKISWAEEPGGLQSKGPWWVGHDWATSLSLFTFHFHALEKEMATHSSVLACRIPGMGEPGGLQSMRSHRVGHNWSDLAAAATPAHPWQQQCF